MIVKKPGQYRLTHDFTIRGPHCIGTTPAGTVVDVTQVDTVYKKVIGPSFYDWTYWDLPVEPVEED